MKTFALTAPLVVGNAALAANEMINTTPTFLASKCPIKITSNNDCRHIYKENNRPIELVSEAEGTEDKVVGQYEIKDSSQMVDQLWNGPVIRNEKYNYSARPTSSQLAKK